MDLLWLPARVKENNQRFGREYESWRRRSFPHAYGYRRWKDGSPEMAQHPAAADDAKCINCLTDMASLS